MTVPRKNTAGFMTADRRQITDNGRVKAKIAKPILNLGEIFKNPWRS